jgi:hypothetical protein
MPGIKALWITALCSWMIPLGCAFLQDKLPSTPVDAWRQVNWTCAEILNNVRPDAPNKEIRTIYNSCETFQIEQYRKAIAKE